MHEVAAPRQPTPEQRAQLASYAAFRSGLNRARDNVGAFIERACFDDHGNPLRLAEMHQQWILHVNYCWTNGLKAMILAHFGSGKSSTLAVPLAAWCLGNDPNMRIKFVTNDDDSAMRRASAVGRILLSPMYKQIFPKIEKGHKWTEHELAVKRPGFAIDASIQARGVITTGIGGRADLIVFDDIVDQRNATQQELRSKVLEFFEQTWLSRLEPDGRVLYIGTPWHQDDATHHLMMRKGWCTLVQRVSADCSTIEQELIGCPTPVAYPLVTGRAAVDAAE